MNKINTRKALNPAYRKHKPLRKDVANFIVQLQDCINAVKLSDDNGESEEHIKSHFTTFFNSTFYADNYINTKDRIDLAIYTENNAKSDVAVIIEAKKPSNKAEFLRKDNLNKKADIVLDHFIPKVVNQKKLKGKAKAMMVTQSIESAIRYYKALQNSLNKKGNPFKIAIAFSGTKTVDGIEYTESEMNGFAEKDTRHKFDEDEYRILVVANKYLTGFDQPKLCAMYVDKKLQGVMAVQALSRLNRAATKLGKKTEDVFVLDFFNSTDAIKDSFDPFYTATSLSEATDVNVLHELKDVLDEVGVYEWSEVEDFNEKFFNKEDAQVLSPIIERAAERFVHELELEDDEKADFKIKAKQFVKIYGQMASILPFEVLKWEKLYWFLKFLIPKLPINNPDIDALDELLSSIDLSTYGLERVRLNETIGLDDSDSIVDPQNPNPRGAHGTDDDLDPLDLIINSFNEKWFQGWEATPDDQRVKFISLTKSIQTHPDFQTKVAENTDEQNKNLAFQKILDDVMAKQRKQELDLYRLYAKDEAFKTAFFDTMKRMSDNTQI